MQANDHITWERPLHEGDIKFNYRIFQQVGTDSPLFDLVRVGSAYFDTRTDFVLAQYEDDIYAEIGASLGRALQ